MPRSRIHLHIENLDALGPVFEAGRQRVREALAQRPALRGRIRTSIGYDGDVLEERLKTADVVFAWDTSRATISRGVRRGSSGCTRTARASTI